MSVPLLSAQLWQQMRKAQGAEPEGVFFKEGVFLLLGSSVPHLACVRADTKIC